MTLTKAVFTDKLIDELELDKNDAKQLVDLFFDEIKNTLERGEAVKLSGFGRFELRDKVERPGRNPKTGEAVLITPRRVVTFKIGNKLKSHLEKCRGT